MVENIEYQIQNKKKHGKQSINDRRWKYTRTKK